MFSKIRNAVLAVAAVAALGAATLATTTSADARGFGGGGGGFSKSFGGGGMRGGSVGIRHVGGGRNFGGMRHIGGGRQVHHGRHHHHNWCRHYGRCHYHVRWHRPLIYGVGAVAATSYAVAPARPCTCLTKEYTPDNLVVFKDVCTKEVASAPIGNTQAQLPLPQQLEQAPAPR